MLWPSWAVHWLSWAGKARAKGSREPDPCRRLSKTLGWFEQLDTLHNVTDSSVHEALDKEEIDLYKQRQVVVPDFRVSRVQFLYPAQRC